MRGRVDDVVVGVGDVVREGAPVFGVFDVAPTAATAWVAEDAAARVAIGDRVALRSIEGGVALRQGVVRALGGGIVEMPARLSPVPGEASFGRAVFIALDGGDGVPLPGQVFEASFVSSSTAAEH
jgi:multidrug resistance efflux pump